jgi:ribose 5-phosphate isomerase B
MKVGIGCDPNASDMKNEIIEELTTLGHEVIDYGSEDPIYANVAIHVAESVVAKECERGIVLCGTGIGVSLAANKVPGAYCALVTDVYQAQRATLSNNANMIAIGAQVTGVKIARLLAKTFLENAYVPGGRSEDKIQRIYDYEKEQSR